MPASEVVEDLKDFKAALSGEWNTPRPMLFRPAEGAGAVQDSTGRLTLSATIAKRSGKLQRVVTLRDAGDGFTMTGCANMRCKRVRWDNGAVWSKVAAVSKARAAGEDKRLQPEDDSAGFSCCTFWGGACGPKKAAPEVAAPDLSHELPVEVISARGLRNSDWTSTPDVYCTVAVESKPGAVRFRTQTVSSVNPVWNYTGLLRDYCVGDSLVFTLWDKDLMGTKEPLGKVVMPTTLFHPNGFEGEVPVKEAGDGVRAFLAVDIAPASEVSGRRPLLSDRQVANIVERVNQHLDVPLVPESVEGAALTTLVSTLNRRLRGALLTFCDRGWVNAVELLLDESIDRKTKTQEVSVVLRHSFRDPLAKALTGIIDSVLEAPGFVEDKLLQVSKYIVNQITEELIESAEDGLEDVGLSISMTDADGKDARRA